MPNNKTNQDFDILLDCLICTKKKNGRAPVKLACRHSFCTKCLKKNATLGLLQGDVIRCPVCWRETPVTNGDIQDLPPDDAILREEETLQRARKPFPCDKCEKNKACSKCYTCNCLMCHDCKETHAVDPKFSSHVVVEELCQLHMNELTCVCWTCCRGICDDCFMSTLHGEHEVCKVDSGDNRPSALFYRARQVLVDEISAPGTNMTSLSPRSPPGSGARRRAGKDDDPRENLNRARQNSWQVINKIDRLDNEYHFSVVNKLTEMTLEVYNAWVALKIAQGECPPETSSEKRPVLKQYIESKGTLILSKPWALDVFSDGSCLIADQHFNFCTRISTKGENVRQYQTADDREVLSAAVLRTGACEEEMVFIVSKGGEVVTVWIGDVSHAFKLQPPVDNLYDIDTDGTNLVIVNGKELQQYSMEGKKVGVLATGDFTRVSAVEYNNSWTYLVSEWATDRLHVFTPEGALVMTIGGARNGAAAHFNFVNGATRIPNGNILAADHTRHLISEFSPDGHFIRHLLTRKDKLSSPRGPSFSYPYLWLPQRNGSILMFEYY